VNQAVILRATLLGLASWLLPFAVSFLFIDRAGQFLIPQPLFKSIMIVIFGSLVAALLVVAFRRVEATIPSGFALGTYWFVINVAFDLAVLVPLIRVPIRAYIYDIGLRYPLIPVIGAAMGAVAERARKEHPLSLP
jgi:hypothetical protein